MKPELGGELPHERRRPPFRVAGQPVRFLSDPRPQLDFRVCPRPSGLRRPPPRFSSPPRTGWLSLIDGNPVPKSLTTAITRSSFSPSSFEVSRVPSDVKSPLMISSNLITVTGWKKGMPMAFSGRLVARNLGYGQRRRCSTLGSCAPDTISGRSSFRCVERRLRSVFRGLPFSTALSSPAPGR